MWSNSSWQPWPQQAMYQNVPHEQVDWAALAKQWIQMREQSTAPTPPSQNANGSAGIPPTLNSQPPSADAGFAEGSSSGTPGFWNNSWGPQPAPPPGQVPPLEAPATGNSWNPPPPASVPVTTTGGPPPKETFDYGHMRNAEPLAAQSFEYNHGSEFSHSSPADFVQPVVTDYGHVSSTTDYSHGAAVPIDQFGFNDIYPPEPSFCQYWPQVEQSSNVVAPPPPPPPFLKKERPSRSEHHSPRNEEDTTTQIDATKRKQLPAWIREGLEKMERERQKKMEKELMEKGLSQNTQSASSRSDLQAESLDDTSEIMLSPKITHKSKFDSESEDEEEESGPAPPTKKHHSPIPPSPRRKSLSPPEEYTMTEEERMAQMMFQVRRMLTEILLEVTNEEITSIAKEVYQRAMAKVPARQLATSSALASITGGLGGLADYGSDSDEDSDEEEEQGDDDSSTSDEELQRRIEERKKAFAVQEKAILAALDEEEALEQEKEKAAKEASRPSKDSGENVLPHKPTFLPTTDSTEDHTSKKVEIIPGLDIEPDIQNTDQDMNKSVQEVETVLPREPVVPVDNSTSVNEKSSIKGISNSVQETGMKSHEQEAKSDRSRVDRVNIESSSKSLSKRKNSRGSSSREASSDSSSTSSTNSSRSSRSRDKYGKHHKSKRRHRSKDRKRHRSRSRSRSPARRRRSRSRSYDRYRRSYHHSSKYRSPSHSPSYSRSSRRKRKDNKYSHRRSRSHSYSPKRSRSHSADTEKLGKKSSGKHWDR